MMNHFFANFNMSARSQLPTMETLSNVFKSEIESGSSRSTYSFLCKNTSENLRHLIFDCSHSFTFMEQHADAGPDAGAEDDYSVVTVPSQFGLENSGRIIPAYYLTGHKFEGKMFVLDYMFTIKDDILNIRPLNERQIKYIAQSDVIDKNELLIMMNNTLKIVCALFLSGDL